MVFDESEMSIVPLAFSDSIKGCLEGEQRQTKKTIIHTIQTIAVLVVMLVVVTIIQRKYSKNLVGYQPS
jgi:hypothetical protein